MFSLIKDRKLSLGNFFVILFVTLVASNLFGGIVNIPSVYICLISVIIFFSYINYGANIDLFVLLIIIYLPLELLLANPDERFKSWQRLIMFILVLLSISPLIQNDYARKFRRLLLTFLIYIVVFASIASFFTYFLGINLMVRNNTNEYLGIAGHYGGLYDHSMKLGPMAAISTIFLLYKGLVTNNKWLYLLSSFCAIAVLFSASRGSFVAMIIASVFVFVKYSSNSQHLIRILMVSVMLITISYPVWNGAMEGLEQKQSANIKSGGTFNSRLTKWNQRVAEFSSSPLYGVGFCSIDPKSKEYWSKTTGTIEPGSSLLSIFSMTGVIGAILFSLFFYRSYIHVSASKNDYGNILIVMCIFFSIHMLSEGYIFAAGNPICIFFWLLIGCCYDMKYISEEELDEL